jgi:hypothetical protein
LVSTDLNLNPETIIILYIYRFKIECTFSELKQVIGAFSYQFWSKSMPKLNRFKRKDEIDAIDKVKDEKVKDITIYLIILSNYLHIVYLLQFEKYHLPNLHLVYFQPN